MFDRLTLRDQQSEMQWVHDYTLGFDGRVVNVVCDISKKNLAGDTTDLHGLFKSTGLSWTPERNPLPRFNAESQVYCQ